MHACFESSKQLEMKTMRCSKLILVSVVTVVWCLGGVVEGFTYEDKEVETEEGKAGMFERWRSHHEMEKISEKEKKVQYENFKATLKHVHASNKANKSFKLEMNRFAGMSKAEFKSKHTGFKGAAPKFRPGKKLSVSSGGGDAPFRYRDFTNVPPAIDWRALGGVSPVKNQGQCASCFAFAAADAVEGLNFVQTKQLVPLSAKEIVDCADPATMGCRGGWQTVAFEYIENNGGLTTENNYPYKDTQDPCNVKKEHDIAVKVGGHELVPANDEESLMKAVANMPIPVAIKMEDDLMYYKEGVLSSPCGTTPDHAILCVGYDTDPDGTKYWILKNSWGESWGEKGYFRILRGVPEKEGYCGVNTQASYPTPDKTDTPHKDHEPMVHMSREPFVRMSRDL